MTHLIPPQNDGHVTDFARCSLANPAAGGPAGLAPIGPGQRTIVWAGWLSGDADPADGVFPPDFRTWSEPGWAALKAGIESLAPDLEVSDATLCLRPAAGCVIADPQACLTFLREHRPKGAEHRFEILLDPVAMLTPDMLPQLEDHLIRSFEALADRASVVGCVLASPVESAGRVRHAPLADHPRAAELITRLWAGSALASRPVLVTDPRDDSIVQALTA